MKQQPVFSIIIPHKNTPELLHRCLNSIPRREDIQIIVVDDNSDENIVDFNHFHGLGEEFIEVYLTKEGKGAGYARNVGLKHAKGKWLLFADADDFFVESAFNHLFAHVDSPYEIIYFKVTSCYSDTHKKSNRDKLINLLINNFVNKIVDAENQLRYKFPTPWGKMIKAELVKRKNVQFDEIPASNDVMFSLITGHFASSITTIDVPIYCYTVNRGSITNTYNLEYLTARYLVTLRRNEFLKEHRKKQYREEIIKYFFFCLPYGIGAFFKFVKLAIVYKSSPFIGIKHWGKKYRLWHKRIQREKGYFIKN